VLASDLSGVREFDTEDQVEAAAAVVNEKLEGLRADHELTQEWLRIGALKGIIIDGDGVTTLGNLFTLFGVTQSEVYFDLEADPVVSVKANSIDVIRYIEDILGGATYNHVHALVGDNFWDLLTSHPEVAGAYNEQSRFSYQIQTQGQGTVGPGRRTSVLDYADIVWENYRGKVGATNFIDPDSAHFFPVGVQGLFRGYYGPANTMAEVNKPGRTIYAMQEPKRWDEGVDLHSESNPLFICSRPKLLVIGHAGPEA
jgi:hypothetical protein